MSKIGTSLIVSQLTPKSAARGRMLLVPAEARIAELALILRDSPPPLAHRRP